MTGRILFIVGAVIMVASLFMPWVIIQNIANGTTYGFHYSMGLVVGLVGLVCLIIGGLRKGEINKPFFSWGVVLVAIAAFALYNYLGAINNMEIDTGLNLTQHLSFGIYIAGVGVFIAFIGCQLKVKAIESPNVPS